MFRSSADPNPRPADATQGEFVTAEPTYLEFLESFNQDLVDLGGGARVAAVAGSSAEMEIVDLDGAPIGRIPIRIDPDIFVALMRVVEQSFAEGHRQGRVRPSAD